MVEFNNTTLLSLSKSQLIVIIHELVDKINLLETRIVNLEERLSAKEEFNNRKKEIPSWVKMNVKSKKKKSRKKRLNSFVRIKDTPTNTIFHSHEKCPNCDGKLGKPSVAYSRQIIDIPINPATITEHVIFKRYCVSCKKRFYPIDRYLVN